MGSKQMKTPGAPAASRPRTPKETTSATRNPMGTSAYRLVDDASASDVRAGMTVARSGAGMGDVNMGSNALRPAASAQATLGANYRVVAKRSAYTETYPCTLSGGRLLNPATRRTDEFYGDAAAYGPLGPG